MAVVVPFLMSATGASAAIAGAIGAGVTATMVSTVTAITFAVTGINDKINKAASKVFGEDLVNFANIAGMGYAMWNGGFDIGTAAEGLPGADAAFEADFAAASGGSAMAGEEILTSGMDSFNLQDVATANAAGTDQAFEQDWADMQAGKEAISDTETFDMLKAKPGMTDQSPKATTNVVESVAEPVKAVTPSSNAASASATTDQYSLSSKPSATAVNATGVNAAGKVGLQAAGSTGLQAPANALTPATGGNNFSNLINKLLYNQKGELNERLVGGVLQGAASAYTGAQANKVRREQYDDEKRRRDSLAPGRFY